MREKKSISIRLERILLQKLHYVARYNGRSTNSHVVMLIRRNIADFERKNGEITESKIKEEDFHA